MRRWEILKNAGISPAPRRTAPAWSQFLRSEAEAILACDFFTADLLDGTRAYVLAVIEHASGRISAAPLKPLPKPVSLDQYRIRRRAHVGGLINEYRLVA